MLKQNITLKKHQFSFPNRHLFTKMASKEDPLPAKVWYDVGIPGLKNAMSPKYGRVYRIFWGMSILFCFLACVLQFYERVQFYNESSIGTVVNVAVDQSMRHGRITFCPRFFFENDMGARRLRQKVAGNGDWKKTSMCDLLNLPGMTMDKLWEMTDEGNMTMTIEYRDHFHSREVPYEVEKFNSYFGLCKEIKLERNYVIASSRLYFHTNYHDPPPLEELASIHTMSIHDEDFVTDLEFMGGQAIPTWNEVRVTTELSKFIAVNAFVDPCVPVDDHFKCKKKCLEDRIRKTIKCSLPFARDATKPTCNSPPQCSDAMEAVKNIYLDTREKNPCPCVRACSKNTYSVVRSVTLVDTPNTDIILGFRSPDVQTVEEYEAFDLVALLCSFGGITGLFLGFCLLSLLELFETAVNGYRVSAVTPDGEKKKVSNLTTIQPGITLNKDKENATTPQLRFSDTY